MKILQFSGYFRLSDDADPNDVEIAFEEMAEFFMGPDNPDVDDSPESPETVVQDNPSDEHWRRFWDALGKGRRLYVTAGIMELKVAE